ncbi:MAG: histidine phosphatase family protein [Pyrinomonadaceae bacterium]
MATSVRGQRECAALRPRKSYLRTVAAQQTIRDMKLLALIRHADAENLQSDMIDLDRPLSIEGRRHATAVGHYTADQGIAVDAIVSSLALRARQTAELISAAAQLNAPTRFDERVYEGTAGTLLEVIQELPDQLGNVLIVGHNPSLEQLFRTLTSKRVTLRPATLVVLKVKLEHWAECGTDSCELDRVFRVQEN